MTIKELAKIVESLNKNKSLNVETVSNDEYNNGFMLAIKCIDYYDNEIVLIGGYGFIPKIIRTESSDRESIEESIIKFLGDIKYRIVGKQGNVK